MIPGNVDRNATNYNFPSIFVIRVNLGKHALIRALPKFDQHDPKNTPDPWGGTGQPQSTGAIMRSAVFCAW